MSDNTWHPVWGVTYGSLPDALDQVSSNAALCREMASRALNGGLSTSELARVLEELFFRDSLAFERLYYRTHRETVRGIQEQGKQELWVAGFVAHHPV